MHPVISMIGKQAWAEKRKGNGMYNYSATTYIVLHTDLNHGLLDTHVNLAKYGSVVIWHYLFMVLFKWQISISTQYIQFNFLLTCTLVSWWLVKLDSVHCLKSTCKGTSWPTDSSDTQLYSTWKLSNGGSKHLIVTLK